MVAVRCCFVLIAASLVHAAPRTTGNGPGTVQNSIHETHASAAQHSTPRASESSAAGYLADLRYMYSVYQECASSDVTSCLKLKLIAAMDRVARSFNEIPIFEGVTFVKDPKATVVDTEPKSEAEIEANLPRSLEDKQDALNGMIADKVSNFIGSHTLQIRFPTAADFQRSLTEEGRGKKKKMSGYLLLPLILGGTMIPLALGALALLAGKALIVSKLALVLAGIIGLKKLLSGSSGGHESGHEVVVAGSGGHSGWGRSYTKEEAQKMAYQAYAPKATS
ncbi:unnamed protein product [Callosobruchus maculatus]|uniref:Protein osiris 8 n=1 Tax=Callosobruchus maculatus TaxID=64391 RepID=A0A653D1Y0_CALMS|nr:unnamed protein product [Callosobruchus maculatus]